MRIPLDLRNVKSHIAIRRGGHMDFGDEPPSSVTKQVLPDAARKIEIDEILPPQVQYPKTVAVIITRLEHIDV